MLKITVGIENAEIMAVGPGDITPENLKSEFMDHLEDMRKNPGKKWIRIESEFIWNERVNEIWKKLCLVNKLFQGGIEPDYDQSLGLLCSIGDNEGYIQQIKGEF